MDAEISRVQAIHWIVIGLQWDAGYCGVVAKLRLLLDEIMQLYKIHRKSHYLKIAIGVNKYLILQSFL